MFAVLCSKCSGGGGPASTAVKSSIFVLRTGSFKSKPLLFGMTQGQEPLHTSSALSRRYLESPLEGPPKIYTDVEKSYAEWKWVERLIPPTTVPPLPVKAAPGQEFPSGWTIPNPPRDISYHIPRNKNHMLPVHTLIYLRGTLRETRIKKIEGNIWQFEKDVGKFLKEHYPPNKVILTYTQEVARYVGIKGDHSELVKEWLKKRGF